MANADETRPLEVRSFGGVITNADARDIAPGVARAILNMQELRPGVLSARRGIQKDSVTTDTSPSTYDLVSVYSYQRPDGDLVVTEDSNGVVRKRKSSAATSIGTGWHTNWPLCFARMRNGDLFGMNGHDRGFRYDGLTAALEEIGMDAPTADPTLTSSPGSGALTYNNAYRYLDDTLPSGIPSSISDLTALATASQGDTFTHGVTGPTQTRAKYVEFYRTLAGDAARLYLVTTQGVSGSITGAVDNGSGLVRITSADHELTTGARVTISGVGGATGTNGTHEITRINDNTFDLQGSTFGGTYTSGGSWVIVGYADDNISDTDLALKSGINVLNADGTVDATQYTPPPTWPSVIVQHQDRAVYGVPVTYDVGALTTNGTTTLTGSGTAWTTDMAGRYIYIAGEPAPLVISSVSSATSITLTTAATTSASGKSYAIEPDPDYWNVLLLSQQDKPEAVPLTANNKITIQVNTPDADRMRGIISFGSYLLVFKERHCYQVSWVVQPRTDASVHLTAYRGTINQRCLCYFEGSVYTIDQFGAYRMGPNGGVEPISLPIQDLWRDATLDFSDTKYWFAQVDPEQRRIRFHVSYTDDSGTLPSRWIEFDVDHKTWTFGQTLCSGMGGGCIQTRSGRLRVLLGGEDDRMYLMHAGDTDGVSSQARGTATSATSTTLTDSGASFGSSDELVGVPVAIVSGTGKGQIRRITAHTGTALTVATWDTTPDSTSVYLVGAIEWTWTSKRFSLREADSQLSRSLILHYLPTATTNSLDLKLYMDWRTTAITQAQVSINQGNLWSREGGADEAVLNLLDQNEAPGYARFDWHAKVQSGMLGNRWWSFLLRGFQGDDPIEVYGLSLFGVQE